MAYSRQLHAYAGRHSRRLGRILALDSGATLWHSIGRKQMFEVFLTGATTGALVVMVGILVIQKLENYQRKQDDLWEKAEAYDRARRQGRI